MIRDLDDKGLGQNSDSSLLPLPCHLFLVASSLTPLPCRFFFVASLCALFNASYWSPSLLFDGELDYRSNYWWHGVDSKKSHCWLVKMVLVKQADKLSKVLDR